LVVGELPEDSQFPYVHRELPDSVKYASLWVTKDMKQIHDIKILWVLMEASIQMWINRRPRLPPMVYNSLNSFANFKVDMYNIYIRARKDLAKQWMKLLFVATNDTILIVLETWPSEQCAPDLAKLEKAETQKKKMMLSSALLR